MLKEVEAVPKLLELCLVSLLLLANFLAPALLASHVLGQLPVILAIEGLQGVEAPGRALEEELLEAVRGEERVALLLLLLLG